MDSADCNSLELSNVPCMTAVWHIEQPMSVVLMNWDLVTSPRLPIIRLDGDRATYSIWRIVIL